MRLIPAVRAFTFTVRVALAAAVAVLAASPQIGRRSMNRAFPGDAALQASADRSERQAQNAVWVGTSFAHGAIMGVVPSPAGAPEELPGAVASNRSSPFDREFRDLLDTLHKKSRQAFGVRSLWRAIGSFLRPSGAPMGGVREETVLDPVFGEIALDLDLRLHRSASSRGGEEYHADDAALRVFEANLLADLERTAPATEFPNGSDYSAAPIGVNTTSSDGGSLVISGYSTSGSATTNSGAGYVPPGFGWPVLAPSAPASGNSAAAGTGIFGGWHVATGPLLPPVPPIGTSFGSTPVAGNGNAGAHHPKFQGVASSPAVPAHANAAAISSQSVAAPAPVTASSHALTSSLVVAPSSPSSPSSSTTLQPANLSTVVLTTLADTDTGTAANDYYNGQAFITGPTALNLASVTIVNSDATYAPVTPKLEVEARTGGGTQGATLYTISGSLNWSFNSSNHQLTFTAPTAFTLGANTGYWLIESDPGTSSGTSSWDYAGTTTNYVAQSGYTIPTSDATMGNFSNNDNGGSGTVYYPLSIGPYLFSLSTVVPEPGSAALLILGAGAMLLRRRREQKG